MKKFMSLALALVMVCSLSVCVFAEDPAYSTEVTYTGEKTDAEGNHTEYYEVTVPATMAPGGSDSVVATGTFPTTRQLNVTAPENVTLTCDIDSSTKVLTVDFADIALAGSNTEEVTTTEAIAVSDISDALFGTWEGTIVYTVGMADVVAG